KAFVQLDRKTQSAIHGHDQHGKSITLLFPSPSRSRGSAALSQIDFTANYAVLGLQLTDHTAFCVHSLSLRVQHLYEWSGITGFCKDDPGTLHDFNIRYTRPEKQTFQIDSDLSLELQATYWIKHSSKEKNLEEDLVLSFESRRGLDLSRCKDLLNAIRHLLHFAVLQPVYPLNITLFRTDCGNTYNGRFIPNEIELWNSIIRERVESECLSERWVFQFKDVQTDFGAFMAKWLDYVEKFGEPLGCYFMTVYHRPPHTVEHLSLTQAFEAYHGIKYVSHKGRDFKDKIKQLAEANKPYLKGFIDDPADFAVTVLHNRNYYTHHNPKWKKDGRVVSGGDLYRLNEKLRLLFQMCVLADMGIRSERFKRLRRQLVSH